MFHHQHMVMLDASDYLDFSAEKEWVAAQLQALNELKSRYGGDMNVEPFIDDYGFIKLPIIWF